MQLDSTFNERTFGAGTFRDFAQKLEKAGVLRVHQGKGGWLVAPAEGVSLEVTEGEAAAAAAPASAPPSEAPVARHERHPRQSAPVPSASTQPAPPASSTPPPAVVGGAVEGVSELFRLISTAEIRKWPLYLRQVKQIVRAQTPPFDERAYGFASLVDLLRAAHKEGAFRVERDRQGVIRVFQAGSAGLAPVAVSAPAPETEAQVVSQAEAPGTEHQSAGTEHEAPGTEHSAPATARRKRAVKSAKPKAARATKAAKAPQAAKKAKS